MKKKNIVKFKITVVTQENLKVLPIIYIISDIKHQKKFLWSSIMVLIITQFIIKELAEEFEGKFEQLSENTENT